MSDEYGVSLERELMANRVAGQRHLFQLQTYPNGEFRRPYETYNIPVTRLDPGPDGVLGNTDDTGQSFTYWEYSPDLSGRRYELFTLTNDQNVDQTYKSVDLSVFKRLSNRWQLLAPYSATRIHFPFMNTGAGTVTGQNVLGADFNPNAEFNTTDDTWEWTAKVSGVYQFPALVMVSAQFEHSSGRPFAREVRFPSLAMNVEPFGTATVERPAAPRGEEPPVPPAEAPPDEYIARPIRTQC